MLQALMHMPMLLLTFFRTISTPACTGLCATRLLTPTACSFGYNLKNSLSGSKESYRHRPGWTVCASLRHAPFKYVAKRVPSFRMHGKPQRLKVTGGQTPDPFRSMQPADSLVRASRTERNFISFQHATTTNLLSRSLCHVETISN